MSAMERIRTMAVRAWRAYLDLGWTVSYTIGTVTGLCWLENRIRERRRARRRALYADLVPSLRSAGLDDSADLLARHLS